VAVGAGVRVAVGAGVLVAVGAGVRVAVGAGVLVAVGAGVRVAVGDAEGVGDGVAGPAMAALARPRPTRAPIARVQTPCNLLIAFIAFPRSPAARRSRFNSRHARTGFVDVRANVESGGSSNPAWQDRKKRALWTLLPLIG
jgi:hypothetical protein